MRILLGAFCFAVTALISSYAFPADVDSDMMDAIRLNDIQKVKDAVARGAHVNAYAKVIEQSNVTPLMLAASSPEVSVEIGRILIKKGAKVDAKDLLGWTPLIYASYYGRTAFAALLIEKGADLNVKSNAGWTPLMYAALSGHIDVAKLLIEKGADVNATTPGGGTALTIAESNGRQDFVTMFRGLSAK